MVVFYLCCRPDFIELFCEFALTVLRCRVHGFARLRDGDSIRIFHFAFEDTFRLNPPLLQQRHGLWPEFPPSCNL